LAQGASLVKPYVFYDNVAARYDTHRDFYESLALALVGRLPDELSPHRILEIGAGTGFATRVLAQRFPSSEIVALEPSDAMRERGLAAVPSAEWRAGTLAEMRSLAGFDLIVSSASAHWLTAEEWQVLTHAADTSALALAVPTSDVWSSHGETSSGGRLLARLISSLRPSPTWNSASRRRADPGALAGAGRTIDSEPWRRLETYTDAAALSDALYERGALLALFGDDAERARSAVSEIRSPNALDFAWSFLLVTSTPR